MKFKKIVIFSLFIIVSILNSIFVSSLADTAYINNFQDTYDFSQTESYTKKITYNKELQNPEDLINSNLTIKNSIKSNSITIFVDIEGCSAENLLLELFLVNNKNEMVTKTKRLVLWNWGESDYYYELHSLDNVSNFQCIWKLNINEELTQLEKGDSFSLSTRWLPNNLRYAPPSLKMKYMNSLSIKEPGIASETIILNEFSVSTETGGWTASLHPIIPYDTQIITPMLFSAKEQRSFNKYSAFHTKAIQFQLAAYNHKGEGNSKDKTLEIVTNIFIDPEDLPPPDTTAPNLYFVIPASSGQSLAPSYYVKVWAEDDASPEESGMSSVTFRTYSDGVFSSNYQTLRDGTSSYWYCYLPLIPTKTYNIYATATDNAGNIRTVSISDVFASPSSDIIPPTVTMLTDINDPLKGIIDIQVSSIDENGVNEVLLKIDAGNWLEMDPLPENIWQWNWDTSDFFNGEHSLSIRAKDSFGNIKTIILSVEILNPINFAVFCASSTFGNGNGEDPPISNTYDGDDCLLFLVSKFISEVYNNVEWEVIYLIEGTLDEENGDNINGLTPNFNGDLSSNHLLDILYNVAEKTKSGSKMYLHISTHLEAVAKLTTFDILTLPSWAISLFVPGNWAYESDLLLSVISYGFYFSTSYIYVINPIVYMLSHTSYVARNVLEVNVLGTTLNQLFMSQGVKTFFWSYGCRGEKLYKLGDYDNYDNLVLWYFNDHSYVYSYDFLELLSFDLPYEAFINNFYSGSCNVVSTDETSIFCKVREAYLALQNFVDHSDGDMLIYTSLSSWEI